MERIGFIGLGAMAQVRELMTEALADGQGDMDNSSLVLLSGKLSNLKGMERSSK